MPPRVPDTLPNSSQQIISPTSPPHGSLQPIQETVSHHQGESGSGSSPQPPWSQLFDTRSDDDDDRLALFKEAAGQSQQTQHGGSADLDEEHEAALAHHHHHHRDALARD